FECPLVGEGSRHRKIVSVKKQSPGRCNAQVRYRPWALASTKSQRPFRDCQRPAKVEVGAAKRQGSRACLGKRTSWRWLPKDRAGKHARMVVAANQEVIAVQIDCPC